MPATSSVHLSLYLLFAIAMAFFIMIGWCRMPRPATAGPGTQTRSGHAPPHARPLFGVSLYGSRAILVLNPVPGNGGI